MPLSPHTLSFHCARCHCFGARAGDSSPRDTHDSASATAVQCSAVQRLRATHSSSTAQHSTALPAPDSHIPYAQRAAVAQRLDTAQRAAEQQGAIQRRSGSSMSNTSGGSGDTAAQQVVAAADTAVTAHNTDNTAAAATSWQIRSVTAAASAVHRECGVRRQCCVQHSAARLACRSAVNSVCRALLCCYLRAAVL